MQFTFIAGSWFALSLALIVLLYLLKRRYTDTEVSSHMLWRRALRDQEANRPWQRLQRQLLLWLQLLAALLLVIALMQPFVWKAKRAGDHVIFVLDASASMHAAAGGSTRLEQAKEQIAQYAKNEASRSYYSLVVMRDQPELVLRKQSCLAGLQAALSAIQPHFGTTEYKETLSLASSLMKEEKEAELRIYTDLQWTESAKGISFPAPFVVPNNWEDERISNAGIVQFGVNEGTNQRQKRAAATLKNWSDQAVSFEAAIFVEASAAEVRSINLKAGEQRTVYFDGLPEGEYYKLSLELSDGLSEDQVSYAFPRESGRKQAALLGKGNLFLEKALAVADIDVLKVQPAADGSFPVPPEKAPDLLILDGVEPAALKNTAWQKLLISKPLWQFTATGEPAQAGQNSESNPSVQSASPPFIWQDHPVTRFMSFQNIYIAAAKKLPEPDWGKAIVEAGQLPLLFAGSERGVPRLLFAFQLQQTDLPLRAEFPVLIRNSSEWLLRQQGGNLGKALAGEKKELPLSPETVKAHWLPVNMGGPSISAEMAGSTVAPVQTIPSQPGLYRLVELNQKGETIQSRLLFAAMDMRESDLNSRIDPELKVNSAADLQDEKEPAKPANLAMTSFVPLVLALLVGVLLLEWEVYRRGHSV